jgi:hypothetical protein
METVGTISRARSSSRLGNIDWQFLTFWLTYFSTVSGLVYVIF